MQCDYCIVEDECRYNRRYNRSHNNYTCDCRDVKIKHRVCNNCGDLRDKIDTLNNELDKLTDIMVHEIKLYMTCEHNLERINEISIELRSLNRRLLENLVRRDGSKDGSKDGETY